MTRAGSQPLPRHLRVLGWVPLRSFVCMHIFVQSYNSGAGREGSEKVVLRSSELLDDFTFAPKYGGPPSGRPPRVGRIVGLRQSTFIGGWSSPRGWRALAASAWGSGLRVYIWLATHHPTPFDSCCGVLGLVFVLEGTYPDQERVSTSSTTSSRRFSSRPWLAVASARSTC